jgi:hypothetical protein
MRHEERKSFSPQTSNPHHPLHFQSQLTTLQGNIFWSGALKTLPNLISEDKGGPFRNIFLWKLISSLLLSLL